MSIPKLNSQGRMADIPLSPRPRSPRAALSFGHGDNFCRGIDVDAFAPLAKTGKPPEARRRIITKVLTDQSDATGIYYDENGTPTLASKQVRDPEFSERYVVETRALLATVPGSH